MPLCRTKDGHLGEVFERHHRDLRGAAADCRACGVERLFHARVGLGMIGLGLRLAAGPKRRAGGIEGDEAAADHHHPAAEVHPVSAIHVEQVVDGLDHAVELNARSLQVAPARHPDGQEHGFEPLRAELGEAKGQ